jgi:hypothetical protein
MFDHWDRFGLAKSTDGGDSAVTVTSANLAKCAGVDAQASREQIRRPWPSIVLSSRCQKGEHEAGDAKQCTG